MISKFYNIADLPFNYACNTETLPLYFIEQEQLEFDEMDFDEPMDVGGGESAEVELKAEAEVKVEPEVKPQVKVEPKCEPQEAMLM